MNVLRKVCAVIDPGSCGSLRPAPSAFAAGIAGAITLRLMLRRSRRPPVRVGNAGSSGRASGRVARGRGGSRRIFRCAWFALAELRWPSRFSASGHKVVIARMATRGPARESAAFGVREHCPAFALGWCFCSESGRLRSDQIGRRDDLCDWVNGGLAPAPTQFQLRTLPRTCGAAEADGPRRDFLGCGLVSPSRVGA